MFKNQISIFIATFLIIGFFFLALPEKGFAGMDFMLGCCRTVDQPANDPGGVCVGCQDAGCFTSESFCESEGGFFIEGPICFEEGGEGARCGDSLITDGCCVTEQGVCFDDETAQECSGNIAGGEIWVSQTSCSEVPQCNDVSNVPTLSEWGLIAMAAILGFIGLFMVLRKKVTA